MGNATGSSSGSGAWKKTIALEGTATRRRQPDSGPTVLQPCGQHAEIAGVLAEVPLADTRLAVAHDARSPGVGREPQVDIIHEPPDAGAMGRVKGPGLRIARHDRPAGQARND